MNTTDEPIVLEECRRTNRNTLYRRMFNAMVTLVFDFIHNFYHASYWIGFNYPMRNADLIKAMQARKNYILNLPGFIRKTRETGNMLLSEFRDIYTKMVQIMFPCAHACTTGSFIVMDHVIYLAFVYEIQGDHLLIMLQSDRGLQELRQGATCGEMLSHAIFYTRRVHFMWAHNGLQYTVLHEDAEWSRKRKFSTYEGNPLRKKQYV